jgi:hypothetical protein
MAFDTGFDGAKDAPVEVLHAVLLGVVKYLIRDFLTKIKLAKNKQKLYELTGSLQSFNTNSLNIPLLKPSYLLCHSQSLVGKDFKIFLQVIPFIFFPFMDDEEKALWHSLAQLSSYIFQTHISYMPTYQLELQEHIRIFMSHVIKFTAQWINKPKFHHLGHLPESILRCGGPASLFSTEKFESYNGVLRNSSSHSNKQAPAQDIAINFSNYQALRFLLSGGIIYDKEKKKASSCSPEILDLFKNNRTIQQSFGYNPDFVNPSTEFPFAKRTTSELADLPVPTSLANMFPQSSINQVAQLQLNRHEIIKKSYFVLVSFNMFYFNFSSAKLNLIPSDLIDPINTHINRIRWICPIGMESGYTILCSCLQNAEVAVDPLVLLDERLLQDQGIMGS